MINYPQQAQQLLEYANQLQKKGYRKKDIAAILETPAPVFSSLFKTILPILANISSDHPDPDERLQFAFSQVNNMSSRKTIQMLEVYLLKLEVAINKKITRNQETDYFGLLKQQTRDSYEFIKQYYEGLYEFYYVSSDHKIVKQETFLIHANPVEKIIEVTKGNAKSKLSYKGIAIMTNHHTLTFQLAEDNEIPQEYVMIHLSLPFIRKTDYLRGIFIAINFACQPIACKVVIRKVHGDWEDIDYNEIETHYYSAEEIADIHEIHQYLTTEPSQIQCFSIPNPTFSLYDLEQELKISKQFKNDQLQESLPLLNNHAPV